MNSRANYLNSALSNFNSSDKHLNKTSIKRFKRSSSVILHQNTPNNKLNENISESRQNETSDSAIINKRNNSEMRKHVFKIKNKNSLYGTSSRNQSRDNTAIDVNSFINIKFQQNTIMAISPSKLQTSKELVNSRLCENSDSPIKQQTRLNKTNTIKFEKSNMPNKFKLKSLK